MNNYCVYLLKNTSNKYTYLGISNNLENRLRKHNGIIRGGARYTKSHKGNGEWVVYLTIDGLTKSESLSIERTCKNLRKKSKGKTPLDKRLYIINKVANEKSKIINYKN